LPGSRSPATCRASRRSPARIWRATSRDSSTVSSPRSASQASAPPSANRPQSAPAQTARAGLDIRAVQELARRGKREDLDQRRHRAGAEQGKGQREIEMDLRPDGRQEGRLAEVWGRPCGGSRSARHQTRDGIGAGLADSCATCHGRPRGSAGFGGNVVTRPDSRDAPHLFGAGLKEMLADEISSPRPTPSPGYPDSRRSSPRFWPHSAHLQDPDH
jgi:hypothetical protein